MRAPQLALGIDLPLTRLHAGGKQVLPDSCPSSRRSLEAAPDPLLTLAVRL